MHEISPPLVAKIFDPLDFFPYIFSEIFSRTFLIFFHTFKNCPGLPKFFTDLPKIFPRPTKNVIFLATFHKFLQICLSNSDVSTTFGHFSQKSPLCRFGSYGHGSHRRMVSTEIIKNWGGGAKWGGQKIIWRGICPLLPLLGAATDSLFVFEIDHLHKLVYKIQHFRKCICILGIFFMLIIRSWP